MEKRDILEKIEAHKTYLGSNGASGEFLELYSVKIEDVDFSNIKLDAVLMQGVHFLNCNFKNTDLFGADLRHSTFESCNFEDSILGKTVWNDCEILKCVFRNADMQRAEILNAKIVSSDFSACNFSGIVIAKCSLEDCIFKVSNNSMSSITENVEQNVIW